MPKQVKDIKEFMKYIVDNVVKEDKKAKKTDKPVQGEAVQEHKPKTVFKKKLIVKHNKKQTKLKLRTKKYLITYIPEDRKNVNKILASLPANIQKIEIKPKSQNKKKD